MCHVVKAQDLPSYWPLCRPGIEKVRKVTKPTPPWLPEDVYSYCRSGHAWLFVVFRQETYAGCVVAGGMRPNEFNGARDMMIWIAYSEIPRAAEFTLPLLEEFARRSGFHFITQTSTRPGMIGRPRKKNKLTGLAEKYGFGIREIVYSKPLYPSPGQKAH